MGHAKFEKFNTKVLNFDIFGILDSIDFLKEINRGQDDETDSSNLSIHLKWSFSSISIEIQYNMVFTKFIKFNTKVLNFINFGFLEDIANI